MFGDEDQPYSSYMKLQWPAAATAQWGHEILQFFFAPKTWRSTKDVKWERNMTQKYDTNYNEMGNGYPLVNQRNYGKSPFLMGKSTINSNFQ